MVGLGDTALLGSVFVGESTCPQKACVTSVLGRVMRSACPVLEPRIVQQCHYTIQGSRVSSPAGSHPELHSPAVLSEAEMLLCLLYVRVLCPSSRTQRYYVGNP